MKYLLIALFLSGFAASQTGSPQANANSVPGSPQAKSSQAKSSQAIPVDQQNEDKAKAVLNEMIQALGGKAYLEIQDVTQEGRGYSFHLGRPTSAGVIFWRFYKYPDQERDELTKKRDIVEVVNGDKGFEITYKGVHPMDAKDLADYLRRREYALDGVLRKWINEPGVAFFYEGSTVADQKPAEQVTIMNAHNQAVTLYMDSSTHLPLKKSFSWRDPTDQQRNVEEEIYDNYRPANGIMSPFVVTRYYNGDMSNQRFLTAIEYNKGLNESLFNVEPGNSSSAPASRK